MDLLYARWRTQTLYAGVKLGIFECIEHAPVHAVEVARTLGLDSALSYRLLRALGSLGLLCEHEGQRFAITETGELLQCAHPQSMRDIILLREGPEHTAVWKHLPAIVRDGKQNGFVREYGATAFEYATHEPAYGEAFNNGMSSHSRLQTAWTIEALRGCDFTSITHLCDVGGGQGHLLCQLLARNPHLVGTVLERSSVIEDSQTLWAERLHIRDRCSYVAGDMFVSAPAADAYIMKMVLHDWSDDECIRILRNLHVHGGTTCRVFIVEYVIPDTGKPDFASLFDIHMMCWGTGRERTVQEYRSLLEQSGWNFVTSWFPPSGVIGVIEGTKAS